MNIVNEEFRLNQILKGAVNGITRNEILSRFSSEKREVIDMLLSDKELRHDIVVLDDKFFHISNTNYRVGKFKDKKYNNRFILIGDDVYSVFDDTSAVDGDIVLVSIVNNRPKVAKIEKILRRDLADVYGEVIMIKNDYYLKPENPKFQKLKIKLNGNPDIIVGSKVVAELSNETAENEYDGTITAVIGNSADPGIDILMEAYKYGIENYFSEDSQKEVDELPLSVLDSERIGRSDLTDKIIFTIDGDDTKDIDDAISLEMLDNGNYKLGVHITDVTHYIEKDSALDKDAYYKGTSSYLAGKVIPMYPSIFSNGIGSLNPNVDRLALTCEMEIDKSGKVVHYNIYESIINSKKQMTYKNVNSIIKGEDIPEGYEEFVDILKNMYKLSLRLKRNRIARGALDLDREELKIELDENGFPIEFNKRIQDDAENLIEEFMLIANETVASCLASKNYPAMYRVHDVPSAKKVQEFVDVLNKIGMPYYRSDKFDLQREMQMIGNELKKYGPVGKAMLLPFLKTLRKANYSIENIGHFGLASDEYVHFTSPIRRYPDNTIHRAIKKYVLSDEIYSDEEIDEDLYELDQAAQQSSERERQADRCELSIIAMKTAEYMEKHIGEKFTGRIIQIDSKGMTIQLDNLIEGRVKINSLPCHYEFNEDTLSLVALDDAYDDYYYGDLVEVEVYNANKENKTIEFEVLKVLEQNKYINPSVNDYCRTQAIVKEHSKVKRKDKRRTKWNS